ncbi:hypothetical protein RHODGE_RHODGE_03517 [Rhodoplanes serenus]|uniref:Uncharacterized protein n=1 Tax=Rhodoplanes serenus TaxID=200615 RepID=A0A447CYM3_9BRAD|nr:hypothetical protein [Rhodoplanes serenus]VCU10328.1 hypothetical protein RHODGE_RHODGE_03517 [Rhodoplanes serenus]
MGRHALQASIEGSRCVAVLRTQAGFGGDRPRALREFVDAVIGQGRFYDLIGAARFQKRSREYFDNQIDIVRNGYGVVASKEDVAKQSFFCSAFVVACHWVVGVIDTSAQSAYPPWAFAPGSLYQEPTFGWLLGYLVPQGGSVPSDDPVLTGATLWRDQADGQWW